MSAFKKAHNPSQDSAELTEISKVLLQSKQRSFRSQMSKLISTPKDFKKNHSSPQIRRASAPILPNGQQPFDNSVYDSNQTIRFRAKINSIDRTVRKPKRT
jgi:hypothetical protein